MTHDYCVEGRGFKRRRDKKAATTTQKYVIRFAIKTAKN